MIFGVGAWGLAIAGPHPLRVYPNPADDVLHMGMEARGMVQYRMLDASGREVLQGCTTAGGTLLHRIDVAALQPGSYQMEVHSAAGQETAHFVKQ